MHEFKMSFIDTKFTKGLNVNTLNSQNTIPVDIAGTIHQNEIGRFVRMMIDYDLAFCPATFVGDKRDIDSFEQQQLFVLD